jgi:cytidylate kinase
MSGGKPVQPRIVVTLDGPSGSGKSTLARQLARELGWHYVDSGAWYRAVTWAVLNSGAAACDEAKALGLLSQNSFQCQPDGLISFDGKVLGPEIRSTEIDALVSDLADLAKVRIAINETIRQQLQVPQVKGVVADGRDAGSVIFPHAQLKVYVDVPLETRALRRHQQNLSSDIASDHAAVLQSLVDRDDRDALRGKSAPVIQPDSRVLDNQNYTIEQAVGCLLEWVKALPA